MGECDRFAGQRAPAGPLAHARSYGRDHSLALVATEEKAETLKAETGE